MLWLFALCSLVSFSIPNKSDSFSNLILREETELVFSHTQNLENCFRLNLQLEIVWAKSAYPFNAGSRFDLQDNFEILANLSYKLAVLKFCLLELKELSYILNLKSTSLSEI